MLKELNSVRPLKRKRSLEESVDHSTEETSDSEDFESSTTTDHQTVHRNSSFPKPILSQEIIDLLPHAQKSKELYQSHWIYGVDTGGQPAF